MHPSSSSFVVRQGLHPPGHSWCLGNVVYSTIFAIVAVNAILFGYVLVAILESDDGDEAGIRKKDI